MDTDADDRAQLIDTLDLRDAVLVGHSTGGDVTRSFGRHGTACVANVGSNRTGATVSEGVRQSFWLQGMLAGIKGQHDRVKPFSENDVIADLTRIDVPTLIIHGDDDPIEPIAASALRSAKIAPQAPLTVDEGAPHGRPTTLPACFHGDLLAFLTAKARDAGAS